MVIQNTVVMSAQQKKDPFFELKQKVIVCIFRDEKFVQK